MWLVYKFEVTEEVMAFDFKKEYKEFYTAQSVLLKPVLVVT